MRGHSPRGVLAVLAAAILWGTTGTAATLAPDVGPLAMGAAALGLGGLLQAAIALPALRRSWTGLRTHLCLVTVGAVSVAAYPLAFYSSMRLGGVAIGTVVSLASAPLASGVLERFVAGHRLGRWWMAAAVLGLAGSVLLCLSSFEGRASDAASTVVGIALGLIAGTAYALYSWAVHGLMAHQLGRAASMGAVFGGGGALLMPVLLLTGAPLIASAQNIAVASYMALVPMFLGYLLFGYGLTRVLPSTATTITLCEPAIAAVLAVMVVGERLGALGWAGLAAIGGCLLVLAVAPATGEPPRAEPSPASALEQGSSVRAHARQPGAEFAQHRP